MPHTRQSAIPPVFVACQVWCPVAHSLKSVRGNVNSEFKVSGSLLVFSCFMPFFLRLVRFLLIFFLGVQGVSLSQQQGSFPNGKQYLSNPRLVSSLTPATGTRAKGTGN